MRRLEFPVYLVTALERLRGEVPEAYHAIGEALGEQPVSIVVEGTPCTVRSLDGELTVKPGTSALTQVATDWVTLFDLLDGRVSLLSALRSDDLRLIGSVDAIVHFESALRAFLAGAVRSPSMPALQQGMRQRLQLEGDPQ